MNKGRRSVRLSTTKAQHNYAEAEITEEEESPGSGGGGGSSRRVSQRHSHSAMKSTPSSRNNYEEISSTPIESSQSGRVSRRLQYDTDIAKKFKESRSRLKKKSAENKENNPGSDYSLSSTDIEEDSQSEDDSSKPVPVAGTSKNTPISLPERRKSSRLETLTSQPKVKLPKGLPSANKKPTQSPAAAGKSTSDDDSSNEEGSEEEPTTEEEESGDDSSDSDGEPKSKKKALWKSKLKNGGESSRILLKITKQAENPIPEEMQVLPDEQYNLESYLTAGNRMKFQPDRSQMAIAAANDSRKGKGRPAKKPRKGQRGTGGQRMDNLPERVKSNFSVTKEASRAATTLVNFDSGKHEVETQRLLESYKTDFLRWIFLMRDGFSVMLHGFGSKIPVFEEFKAFIDGNALLLTINGLFARKINPKKLLVDFCNNLEFLDEEEGDLGDPITVTGNNVDAMSEDVANQLKMRAHRTVYFMVMNFDSLALNQPGLLTILSNLNSVEWIHILASIDSVNGILGVNQNQVTQFNFYWITCSTFQPYQNEFASIPNIFGESNATAGGEHALQFVLKSLTGNAKKAFKILASIQLSKMKNTGGRGRRNKEFLGVEFGELARKCKESFIAHSDAALKTLLVEFIDHKLISHQGKSKGSVGNLLTVELDLEALEKVLNDGIL